MAAFAAMQTEDELGLHNRSCGDAPFAQVDGASVTMLLSPYAIKEQNNKGGRTWRPLGSKLARPTEWHA